MPSYLNEICLQNKSMDLKLTQIMLAIDHFKIALVLSSFYAFIIIIIILLIMIGQDPRARCLKRLGYEHGSVLQLKLIRKPAMYWNTNPSYLWALFDKQYLWGIRKIPLKNRYLVSSLQFFLTASTHVLRYKFQTCLKHSFGLLTLNW